MYSSNIRSVRKVLRPLESFEESDDEFEAPLEALDTNLNSQKVEGEAEDAKSRTQPQQRHNMQLRTNRRAPERFHFYLPRVPFRSHQQLATSEEVNLAYRKKK